MTLPKAMVLGASHQAPFPTSRRIASEACHDVFHGTPCKDRFRLKKTNKLKDTSTMDGSEGSVWYVRLCVLYKYVHHVPLSTSRPAKAHRFPGRRFPPPPTPSPFPSQRRETRSVYLLHLHTITHILTTHHSILSAYLVGWVSSRMLLLCRVSTLVATLPCGRASWVPCKTEKKKQKKKKGGAVMMGAGLAKRDKRQARAGGGGEAT